MHKNTMKFILMVAFLFAAVSASAADRNKVEVSDNGRVRITTNGVTKEAGHFRKSETRFGETKIYTNRDYGKPAVTLDRNGRQVEEEDEDE